MFTGIIEAVGEIREAKSQGGDVRLLLDTGKLDLSATQLGDSIAVNGICLTVIELTGQGFAADVSRETLSCTTLGDWQPGQRVNLEKALLPTTPLGGHLVSGHVDGLGEVTDIHPDARSTRISIRAPENLARYIAAKGSICVDGTSLTVNRVEGAVFELNIVPHTIQETVIGDYAPGTTVNLEVDIIARYLERMMLGDKAAAKGGVTEALLQRYGFIDDAG